MRDISNEETSFAFGLKKVLSGRLAIHCNQGTVNLFKHGDWIIGCLVQKWNRNRYPNPTYDRYPTYVIRITKDNYPPFIPPPMKPQ